MRWDDLFRDLEAQLDAAEAAELDAEVADRTRREAAQLGPGRPGPGRGRAPGAWCGCSGPGPVDGVLVDVGSQWLLVAETGGREVLVPSTAVVSLAGLRAWSGAPGSGGQVFARLGLGSRAARDRPGPAAGPGAGSSTRSVVSGTVDRVGADFLEVTEHGAGEPRRRAEVTAVRTVPFAALALVRSGP